MSKSNPAPSAGSSSRLSGKKWQATSSGISLRPLIMGVTAPPSVKVYARRANFSGREKPAEAQVSEPAVSPISKSAGCGISLDLQVWKPAIQQTWKSALLGLRLGRARSIVLAIVAGVAIQRGGTAEKVQEPVYAARATGSLTFNRSVAPIIFANCSWCHRPGQSAPFTLLNYADVKKHAADIARVTANRYMPPWLPEQGYGEFAGERRLSAEQLGIIQQWVKEGAPEGNPADLPPIPQWTSDWHLGPPDLIVRPDAYSLAPDGRDVYYNFVVPIPTSAIRFVRGVEFQPGNPRVVHHSFIEIDQTRDARRLAEVRTPPGFYGMETPEGVVMPGGQLLGWQPGKLASFTPPGLAWVLHTNTDLVLQVHMNPSGKPETVQPSVGFYFTGDAPTNSTFRLKLTALDLEIPPGLSNYVAEQSYELPVDVSLTRVGAHAHYLCKDMQAYAILPGGKKEWLLWIKDWDFNWQGDYGYAKPVTLPKGSKVVMRYTYDNTANNIRNPNHPPKHVRFGTQSTDEMGELYFQVLPRNKEDYLTLGNDYTRYFFGVSLRHYVHLIEIDPNDARGHKRLGRALGAQGKVDEGIAHLQKAIALKPDEDEPHYDLASIFLRAGRMAEAFAEFREVVRLNPRDYQALGSLGIISIQTGKLEEAADYFQQALRANPDDPIAKKYLDIVRARLGR